MTTSITTNDSRFTKVAQALVDIPTAIDTTAFSGGGMVGWHPGDNPSLFIRDDYFAKEGMRYFSSATAAKLKSSIDGFLANQGTLQLAAGEGWDHWDPVNNSPTPWWRNDAENDIEYLHILQVYLVWMATGDDSWMSGHLAKLEAAWDYVFSDALRYDSTSGLPMRVHTPDTWDIDFGIRGYFNSTNAHGITDQVMSTNQRYWVILTTDVAGYALAAKRMAEMYAHIGDATNAAKWNGRLASLQSAATTHLWDATNSRWKYHKDITLAEGQTITSPYGLAWSHTDANRYGIAGNAYANVRGLSSSAQAATALSTYKAWKVTAVTAKPWAIFYPPYPNNLYRGVTGSSTAGFNLTQYGYANGGLAPWVGALWATAAFAQGDGATGWELLSDVIDFYNTRGKVLCSFYNNSLSPWAAENGDGWNLGPITSAIIEGLAGIVSSGPALSTVTITPRWGQASTTGHYGKTYTARADFPASSTYAAYTLTYSADGSRVTGTITGTHSGGTLDIAGFAPITLVGGTQSIDTASPLTITPTAAWTQNGTALSVLAPLNTFTNCHASAVSTLGGTLKFTGTHADRFTASLDGTTYTPTVTLPAGTTTVYLGVTPQGTDTALTARVGVPM